MMQRMYGAGTALGLLLAVTHCAAQEAVTNNRHQDWQPVLSPDGATLVYLSKRGATDLWAMDLASRKERRLTTTSEREKGACFSPDGKRLAFLIMRNLEHRVQVLDMATGAVRDVGPGDAIAWSPDAARIASRDENGIFLLHVATAKRRRLVAASRAGAGSIRWSRRRDVIYHLHEGDLWEVTTGGASSPRKLFSGKEEDKRANLIYFVPDPAEKRFIALVDLGRLSIRGKNECIILGPGGRRKRLGPMQQPIWAPGGRGTVFCRDGNLYEQALDSAAPTHLAGEGNACASPVISPDGAWVYFAARNPERRGAGGRILSKYAEVYRAPLAAP